MKKSSNKNIQIYSTGSDRLKRLTAYEELPCQTLITSTLHRYAAGYLEVDSR